MTKTVFMMQIGIIKYFELLIYKATVKHIILIQLKLHSTFLFESII